MTPKEAKMLRDQILKKLGKSRMTSPQLAESLGQITRVVSQQLTILKRLGLADHDGDGERPRWFPVSQDRGDDNQFRPQADPHLKSLMSKAWRGTWMQGLEVVL